MTGETAHDARLAPPDPARPPLKVNIFDFMRVANTSLVPLFPYLEPGCIVPTGNAFRAGPGRDTGVFEHFNTVDEVSICFAGRGSRVRPGQVTVGANTHRVGGFFANAGDPDSFVLISVTQRQAEAETDQQEALAFFCAKCQEKLLSSTFDGKPERPQGTMPRGCEQYVETVVAAAQLSEALNGDAQSRICTKCGHENPPFPVEQWGWRAYRDRVALMQEGWRQYASVISEGAE
jgi:hypothetical protein